MSSFAGGQCGQMNATTKLNSNNAGFHLDTFNYTNIVEYVYLDLHSSIEHASRCGS